MGFGGETLDHCATATKNSSRQHSAVLSATRGQSANGCLKAFHQEHKNVVFKKLDGMGGASIFRVMGQTPTCQSF